MLRMCIVCKEATWNGDSESEGKSDARNGEALSDLMCDTSNRFGKRRHGEVQRFDASLEIHMTGKA